MTEHETGKWMPGMSLDIAKKRATLLQKTRDFFQSRNILEVETPLLCHTSTPDPMIDSFILETDQRTAYLQTSPEFAMKRLLAANYGPIYQICKAFRKEESGRYHNPEFTLLEWYRPGFNHHDLMNEMDLFLQATLSTGPCDKISYQALFEKHCNINPLDATVEQLTTIAKQNDIHYAEEADKDTWLHLILSHAIEPTLGKETPIFIYDYPKSQAALSVINGDTAERFEVYFKGVELANGFHELTDANEQQVRFEKENKLREKTGKHALPVDHLLLSALESGLPSCAGVALGFDRLVMLALDSGHIKNVVAFTTKNA